MLVVLQEFEHGTHLQYLKCQEKQCYLKSCVDDLNADEECEPEINKPMIARALAKMLFPLSVRMHGKFIIWKLEESQQNFEAKQNLEILVNLFSTWGPCLTCDFSATPCTSHIFILFNN